MPLPRVRVRATAWVRDGQGRVLLALQPGDPAPFWILPGGGTEAGERSREAVVRELREETGLDCVPEDLVEVREEVAVPPTGDDPVLHVEMIWRVHLTAPCAAEGSGEHPWRFFEPAEVPSYVKLPRPRP